MSVELMLRISSAATSAICVRDEMPSGFLRVTIRAMVESTGARGRSADVLALCHDLRNPLGVVTLSVDALLRSAQSDERVQRLAGKHLATILRSTQSIEQGLERLAHLAGDLAPDADPPVPGHDGPPVSLTAESLQTIGLAFVHELVRMQGGDVQVVDAPGQPTSFRVVVPPASTPARGSIPSGVAVAVEQALRWLPNEELRKTLEAAMPNSHGRSAHDAGAVEHGRMRAGPSEANILLAEDNAELRGYIADLLFDRWTVEAVGDGEKALAAARKQTPDLVLADIMMPGMDGLSLARQLRADPRTRHVPIVILSAQVGRESRMEGELAGADDYLVKPFSSRDLMARVALHLQLGRERAARAKAEQHSDGRSELAARIRRSLIAIREALPPVRQGARGAEPGAALDAIERETARMERVLSDLLA
jgi:CheY-like chemotaxis protein